MEEEAYIIIHESSITIAWLLICFDRSNRSVGCFSYQLGSNYFFFSFDLNYLSFFSLFFFSIARGNICNAWWDHPFIICLICSFLVNSYCYYWKNLYHGFWVAVVLNGKDRVELARLNPNGFAKWKLETLDAIHGFRFEIYWV